MRTLQAALARLGPVVGMCMLGLVVLCASRLGLSLWHHAEVSDVDGWAPVLLQGLRVDIASLCLLFGPLAALLLLVPARALAGRGVRRSSGWSRR